MNQQEAPNRVLPAIVAMAIVVGLLWFFLVALAPGAVDGM
jgi:hypothetical protein